MPLDSDIQRWQRHIFYELESFLGNLEMKRHLWHGRLT